MTRLPSSSFLPSGGIDCFDCATTPIHNLHGRPDGVMSPFSLPHSIKQAYFDTPNNLKPPPANHAPPSSLLAASNARQHLSPEHHSLSPPMAGAADSGSSITSPSMGPTNPGTTSPFGHLSPQTTATLLQRRDEYSRRLLENWQAERAHLEASRARAEEMFREERNIMDEERLIWVELKTKLENEVMHWKQKLEAAESEVAKYVEMLGIRRNGEGKLGVIFHGGVDGVAGNRRSGSSISPETGGPSTSSAQTPMDGISPSSLPPGRGSTIPESNPFVPLDPRMQTASPQNMTTRKEQERVPSIDINDVIPGLEGIRLKAPAVQKSTFNDEKPPSSTVVPAQESPSTLKKGLAEPQSKSSPAVMTKLALKAPEHRRLTMHAGHTPNHSMSFSQLPTMDSTAGNTASSTGTSTPTSPNELKTAQVNEAEEEGRLARFPDANQDHHAPQAFYYDGAMSDEPIVEPVFEPSDEDPALKGPLCLKNRPAADEMFLRRLSDKLEEVKATDATPSVLNETTIPELIVDSKACLQSNSKINDNHPEDALEEVEEDIPLKLRKSSNFGQPLGKIRRTSGF
ncbi:hypothetical protein GGS24DRAFT_499993 [Hypoxylon argillaceum]|nr:hypothetical protein GGS24DRAFT_499993 [Hypoxylon argillaceum]